MRVEMLKTAAGPEFAHCVGVVYDMPNDRANALVKDGAAKQTKRKAAPVPQPKQLSESRTVPRVRMLTTVPSHGGPDYTEGVQYDLAGTVASALVRAGVAVFVQPTTERMVIDPPEKREAIHA